LYAREIDDADDDLSR